MIPPDSETVERDIRSALAEAEKLLIHGRNAEGRALAAGALRLLETALYAYPNAPELRGQLHSLLADLTGELSHFQAAAFARPDSAPARAALGCAFARAGRFAESLEHLRFAVRADPFDRPAARAFFQALADAGAIRERAEFARGQLQLHRAAPDLVPLEDWFRDALPDGTELASILVLCCNELAYTRQCLDAVLANTRAPYELILLDNGSSDGTGDYLESLTSRSEPARIVAIREPNNLGFPGGVNRCLREARGEYIVLLNNDAVVSPGWLDILVRAALCDYPHIGLVGAVSNFAGGIQQIPVPYRDPNELPAFAARRRVECAAQLVDAPMLSGFCLLLRRAVLDAIGGLDERFGLGFFYDDDLSRRARGAGFRLAVAPDCFVHHHGSRTFLGLGIDPARQLETNAALFREKWHSSSDNPVSLTMIVKNEERNLAACLAPLKGLVGEMVVADTGSTDRTVEIARSFGAKLVDFPWIDHFAAARNAALENATKPWIFWMDADDRLDETNARKLNELFRSLRDENVAYVFKCECVAEAPGASATVVDHVRLFRRDPRVRWTYRVHEQILPALRAVGIEVRWTDIVIRHVGYVDAALRGRKLDRDERLLRLELRDRPDEPFSLFNLGSVLRERGDIAGACAALERSLELSHPKDSIVRKLYALIAGCHAQLGDRKRALEVCRRGREIEPDDAELLFLEAGYRRDAGDPSAAVELYRRLLGGRPSAGFASIDTGLVGAKAHHNLALALLDLGRRDEALGEFRAALQCDPHFAPSRVALVDLTGGTVVG